MRLVQFEAKDGGRKVGVADDASLCVVAGATRVLDLALEAARAGGGLQALVESRLGDDSEDYGAALADRRVYSVGWVCMAAVAISLIYFFSVGYMKPPTPIEDKVCRVMIPCTSVVLKAEADHESAD